MEIPIISTKLNVPGLSSHQISRSELTKKLDISRDHKLTLICAPAGFGKSSLVSAWSLRQENVAWLSIDESDNDPVSFFNYFFHGFGKLSPRIGSTALSALQDRENVNFNNLIFSLINDLSETDGHIFFVLDDYHLIEEEKIHKLLQILLDRMPDQFHLIIVTRSDPPFSLARLRSSEMVNEIRADDLKFDISETDSFLNEKWQLDINADDIKHLHSKTEGWIAGLQLSAFSLNKIESKSEFIKTLSGDDRYIADFLAEQVLNTLSEKEKNFLLKISVLQRFCGSLIDEVAGEVNSAEILNKMEKENLFIIPLDHQRKWFRFHHLFSELLRQRFTGTNNEISELHRRASAWFDLNGYPGEAIDYAVKSKDSDCIISIIEKYANNYLMIRGETKNLHNWLKQIPDGIIESSIRLNLTYAWVLFYELDLPRIMPFLDNVHRLLESEANEDMKAEYETVLATIAILKGELLKSVEKFNYALETISSENELMRGVILFGLGYGYITIREYEKADAILEDAGRLNKDNGNTSIALKAFCFLAMCRIQSGRNKESYHSINEAIEIAEKTGFSNAPIMSLVFSTAAELARQENNIVDATEKILKAIEIAQKHNDSVRLITAYMVMAQIKVVQKSFKGSMTYIDKIDVLLRDKTTPLSSVRSASMRNRIRLLMGQLTDTSVEHPDDNWLSRAGIFMIPGYICEYEHLTFVSFLMSEEKYKEAELVLNDLLAKVDGTYNEKSKSEILSHLMIVHFKAGNETKALDILLELARYWDQTKNIALFLEYPQILEKILKKAEIEKGNKAFPADFLTRLSANINAAGHKNVTQELVVPLSRRELEVLLMLDTDLTNQEIAEKLFVSVNTLKAHIKNINNKLDTANRKEALSKAKEIGLF